MNPNRWVLAGVSGLLVAATWIVIGWLLPTDADAADPPATVFMPTYNFGSIYAANHHDWTTGLVTVVDIADPDDSRVSVDLRSASSNLELSSPDRVECVAVPEGGGCDVTIDILSAGFGPGSGQLDVYVEDVYVGTVTLQWTLVPVTLVGTSLWGDGGGARVVSTNSDLAALGSSLDRSLAVSATRVGSHPTGSLSARTEQFEVGSWGRWDDDRPIVRSDICPRYYSVTITEVRYDPLGGLAHLRATVQSEYCLIRIEVGAPSGPAEFGIRNDDIRISTAPQVPTSVLTQVVNVGGAPGEPDLRLRLGGDVVPTAALSLDTTQCRRVLQPNEACDLIVTFAPPYNYNSDPRPFIVLVENGVPLDFAKVTVTASPARGWIELPGEIKAINRRQGLELGIGQWSAWYELEVRTSYPRSANAVQLSGFEIPGGNVAMMYESACDGVDLSPDGVCTFRARFMALEPAEIPEIWALDQNGNYFAAAQTVRRASDSYVLTRSNGDQLRYGRDEGVRSTNIDNPVGSAFAMDGESQWIVNDAGEITGVGRAPYFGDLGGLLLNAAILGVIPTATGQGYWLLAADGGVFSFGDAEFFGSTGGLSLNAPIVDMAPAADGAGYWLVARDGGIFAFGSARFLGSMGAVPLNQPIVGMESTVSGDGYWLVAADGGVFAFGDAAFHGSTGHMSLNSPIVDMAVAADGNGYWMAARDGGIFAFGNAQYLGSAAGEGIDDVVGFAVESALTRRIAAEERQRSGQSAVSALGAVSYARFGPR